MADLKDVNAGILEVQVYEGVMVGGAPVELTVTLLDIRNDALPMSKPIRESGAQAYGMLFFKSDSPRCPKQGVIWERFEDGLEVGLRCIVCRDSSGYNYAHRAVRAHECSVVLCEERVSVDVASPA